MQNIHQYIQVFQTFLGSLNKVPNHTQSHSLQSYDHIKHIPMASPLIMYKLKMKMGWGWSHWGEGAKDFLRPAAGSHCTALFRIITVIKKNSQAPCVCARQKINRERDEKCISMTKSSSRSNNRVNKISTSTSITTIVLNMYRGEIAR